MLCEQCDAAAAQTDAKIGGEIIPLCAECLTFLFGPEAGADLIEQGAIEYEI